MLDEARRGDPVVAQGRLALLAPLARLEVDDAARALAQALSAYVPLPAQAREDAYHIATAAANGMACLLTWNCKHIANPRLERRIERICSAWGYKKPKLCTPAELLNGE